MNKSLPGKTETGSPAARIAALAPADAEELARLHGKIFPDPWRAGDFRQLLMNARTIGLAVLAPGAGVLAGFAIIHRPADEAEILTLGISPVFHRRGYGRALVAAISKRAADQGCVRVFLDVAEDNLAAQNLYGQSGYLPVGRRRGYYRRKDGPAIDALLLSCNLGCAGADSL